MPAIEHETIPTVHPENYWLLAGYARSGAALVRTIFANCFDMPTSSTYRELKLGPEYCRLLKHKELGTGQTGQLLDNGPLLVKTHEWPHRHDCHKTGQVPHAVVIVRDGRRVLGSLRAFYAGRNGLELAWEDMIVGKHRWGSWSEWVRQWATHCTADTLWIRYEDVMREPEVWIDKLAERFKLKAVSYDLPSIDKIKKRVGKAGRSIFRKADMAGNGGMPADMEALFWQTHGWAMGMLGYDR